MSEQQTLATTLLQGQSQATYLEQLSDDEFWAYAARLAASPPPSANQIGAYLECELQQGETRAIFPLAAMREVVPPPHLITRLPSTPAWMPGLTAWRSEPIPVVDLDAYFAGKHARYRNDQTILVVQDDQITLGFFVAVVGSLTSLDIERLQPTSHTPHLFLGMHENALVLNVPAILTDMMQQIREMDVYE